MTAVHLINLARVTQTSHSYYFHHSSTILLIAHLVIISHPLGSGLSYTSAPALQDQRKYNRIPPTWPEINQQRSMAEAARQLTSI